MDLSKLASNDAVGREDVVGFGFTFDRNDPGTYGSVMLSAMEKYIEKNNEKKIIERIS